MDIGCPSWREICKELCANALELYYIAWNNCDNQFYLLVFQAPGNIFKMQTLWRSYWCSFSIQSLVAEFKTFCWKHWNEGTIPLHSFLLCRWQTTWGTRYLVLNIICDPISIQNAIKKCSADLKLPRASSVHCSYPIITMNNLQSKVRTTKYANKDFKK